MVEAKCTTLKASMTCLMCCNAVVLQSKMGRTLMKCGSDFASPSERYEVQVGELLKAWRSYVCTDQKRYVPIVTMHTEPLPLRQKFANFGGDPPLANHLDPGLPAYILPDGNRDNDVPVVVAVSTTRKRYFTC